MTKQILLIACAVAMLAATGVAAHEAASDVPSVHVSASGWVEKAPEIAQVVLAVETTAKTAQDATEENADRMAGVIRALKRAGIAKSAIRTVGFHVSPRYPQEQRRGKIEPIGYTASNSIEVTVDPLDKAGEVIDAAIEAGANRSDQLSFGLKEPEKAQLEALADAMRRARIQAEVLARAVGKHVGDALRISTAGGGSPGPYPKMMRAMAEAMPTPIEAGPIRTTASVDVTYILTPFDMNDK